VTSRLARYSASRVALPPTNCAVTAAAQIIAMKTGVPGAAEDSLIFAANRIPRMLAQSVHEPRR
jgi:hypothetical protein